MESDNGHSPEAHLFWQVVTQTSFDMLMMTPKIPEVQNGQKQMQSIKNYSISGWEWTFRERNICIIPQIFKFLCPIKKAPKWVRTLQPAPRASKLLAQWSDTS
jgi:hypothetical protein